MYHVLQTGSTLITETFTSKRAALRFIAGLGFEKPWNSYEVLTDRALEERRSAA